MAKPRSRKAARRPAQKPAQRQTLSKSTVAPASAVPEQVAADEGIGRAAQEVEDIIARNGGKDSTGAARVLHELLAHSMLVVRALSEERARHTSDAAWIKQFNEACEQSAEFSKRLDEAAPKGKPPAGAEGDNSSIAPPSDPPAATTPKTKSGVKLK